MRELKFRIWDGNNKHFVYPDILELDRGLEYQQSTGLLDKQGKEIYEGDIVSRNGIIGSIEFGEYEIWWHRDDGNVFAFQPFHQMGVEVIGNIYDMSYVEETNET